MKKYLKSTFLLLFSVLLSCTFVSCGNPIDELNTEEKLIYEAIIENKDEWYKPCEMELIGVHCELYTQTDGFLDEYDIYDEDNYCLHAFVKLKLTPMHNIPKLGSLNGQNYTGYFSIQVEEGKSTEQYFEYGSVNPYGYDETFYSHSTIGSEFHTYTPDESKISAKKIQAAIDQYWEDAGLK